MNTGHNDINKIIPYGESLRGFSNQKFLSQFDIHNILKERGIFVLNQDKDFTIPVLQTLLLSPKEFDKIREAFSTKEDNRKTFSREIKWVDGAEIFIPDILTIDTIDYLKRKLPTCSLEKPIGFFITDDNKNHLRADFEITRKDLNKSWYEQTNKFTGSVEFINEKGKGRIVITHTAPETKQLSEFIVKELIRKYKEKGAIPTNEELKKILFKDFNNSDRFVFFFRLTNSLDCLFFKCQNVKDISIKPEETVLPEEIEWMDHMDKIILSGDSLDKKFFVHEKKYHKDLILWSIDAVYSFSYKKEEGSMSVTLGFPDYLTKGDNAEFELNISSLNSNHTIDSRTRRQLKADLLSELDRQKSIVYDNFLTYKGKTK